MGEVIRCVLFAIDLEELISCGIDYSKTHALSAIILGAETTVSILRYVLVLGRFDSGYPLLS